MNPIEIAQQIEVKEDKNGRGYTIHVPSWFAIAGVLLTLASVSGTAVSLAALWSEFKGHTKQEWHDPAAGEVRAMVESLIRAQATQGSCERRLDALERRIEKQHP